jgi:hypothetical protein
MCVPAILPVSHVADQKVNKVARKMIPTGGRLFESRREPAAAILARAVARADLGFSVRIFIRG